MDVEQRGQIAARIRDARKSRGWSQVRLAAEAGVAENTVVAIEGGKRHTQGGKLRAVLDALGLAPAGDAAMDLEGVPDDVRLFLRVAGKRLAVLDEDTRTALLADLYPRLLDV